ncbi:NADH-dependent flavin oxidoreductase, Oye family [Neocallimastix sp. 'constans']|jgi:2,4-dienoyl-CoA reductase-like NADH-dependent reductase (Old Yellow Enzyme family)
MYDNSKLFEKVKLNNGVEVPSRLGVPPMTLFLQNPDGSVNDYERHFFQYRGENVGLYILGAVAVTQDGIAFPGGPRAICEADLAANEERCKLVKEQGALAINQLHHGGIFAVKKYTGLNPIGPSADVGNQVLKDKNTYKEDEKVLEMTDEQIRNVIKGFGFATELSIKAGYDGIEIHGANNFILQQFYSAYYNRRTDEWGGTLEKRMKFCLDVLDICIKAREKMNRPDFIIGYRLSPEEPFENGITMTETLQLVRELLKRPIQYIHCSQKNFFQETKRGEGAGIPRLKVLYDEIKGRCALVGVGSLLSAESFNKALNAGYCDFFCSGVGFIVNRHLGKYLKENKEDEIKDEIDPDHPELYGVEGPFWKLCVEDGDDSWLPKIKGKHNSPPNVQKH